MKSRSEFTESDKLGPGEEGSGEELEKSPEKSGSGMEKSPRKSWSREEKSWSELEKNDKLAFLEEKSDPSPELRSPALTLITLNKAMAELSRDSRQKYFSQQNSALAYPFYANRDPYVQNPSPDTDQVVAKPDTPAGPIGQDSG